MDAGTKVYRCTVYSAVVDHSDPYYTQEATGTGIVVDGRPMVRLHDMLLPAEGWHETERDAKAAVVVQLVRMIGQLQAVVDELRDEMLHADLTTEEAAR